MRGSLKVIVAVSITLCMLFTGCIGEDGTTDKIDDDTSDETVPLVVGDWMTYDVQECIYDEWANYSITITIDEINSDYAVFNTTERDGSHSLANQPKGILQWAGTLGYTYKGVKYVDVPGMGTIQALSYEKKYVDQNGVERFMNMVVVDNVPLIVSIEWSTPQGFRNYMLNDTSVSEMIKMAE